jgi:hypothetical protein
VLMRRELPTAGSSRSPLTGRCYRVAPWRTTGRRTAHR